MRRLRFASLVLVAGLAAACGEPPSKEMGQAQGAIDAARAAGAESYATTEFKAAVDALARSQDAVNQRDYRLALNHALDSRERAQNAAKIAADQKAIVRSEAERLLNETALALVQANTRLKPLETAKATRQQAASARTKIDAAENAVQKARAALDSGDYLGARETLRGAMDQTRQAAKELEAVPQPPPLRKRK
jgi:hypothetical protein